MYVYRLCINEEPGTQGNEWWGVQGYAQPARSASKEWCWNLGHKT